MREILLPSEQPISSIGTTAPSGPCRSPQNPRRAPFAVLLAVFWLLSPGCAAGSDPVAQVPSTNDVLVGIGPFPYDLTLEAVQRVTGTVRDNANVYAVQLDNGIPWEAALAGSPIDAGLMDQWRRHKESIASHHKVYLAIAPLAEDRVSWAAGFEGKAAPAWARDETQLTEQLKVAYTRYVLDAVAYFQPAFLNVGVEAGDMAAKRPAKWPLFEALFTHVASAVRARYPGVKLGISFGLPLLQEPGVLDRARKLIDESDYLGISFYPYMSEFYVKLGAAPLPAPPDQWRKPLDWLAANARKPIAMCETAYASEPATLEQYKLRLGGDPTLQSHYVSDLAAIARRDHYLFTVFFLTVDYDALMQKLRPGDETVKLWWRTGFFDTSLAEKPAWSAYQKAWLNRPPPPSAPATGSKPIAVDTPSSGRVPLGFASPKDLFVAPAPDEIWLEQPKDRSPFMHWGYDYRSGQFSWATRDVTAGAAKGASGLVFQLRSDRNTPLLLQIEESDGEAFFAVLTPKPDWATIEIPWADFRPDPSKKRNGTLDIDRLVRLMLADGAAVDRKATGHRVVEMGQLDFLRTNR